MTANSIVPTNMTTFQFIVAAVTGVSTGKKMKTQTTSRNMTAPTLMKIPAFPRDHRRVGKGSFRNRRRMRQMKDIMYVASKAETASEPIALKATVDPMLINERRQVMTKVIMTAFKGIFQAGFTWQYLLLVLFS
jgi:hypothetical protein